MPVIKTPYRPGTPCWIDLVAPDQQGALEFYRNFLGWSGEIGPPETGGYSVCMMKDQPVGGIMSAQAMGDDEPPPPTVWTTYFCVEDADATERAVRQAGGNVIVPPMDVMTLGRMMVAADPTGAVFGTWQPKDFHGIGLANEPGTLVWNELDTNDKDAASAFYSAALGLETAPMEGAKDYYSLRTGGKEVGGMRETDRPGVPPHWLVYFSVEDCDRAAAMCAENGGDITQPPFDMEAGRMALLKDQQGAPFAVIAVRPPAAA